MTMDQIECFVTVASTGSISQAALHLFRSQPNLSYTLKQLETELGYALLRRTNHGVNLTADGLVFLEQAQKTLMQFQQLKNFCMGQNYENSAVLRVAAMPFCMATDAVSALYHRQRTAPSQVCFSECMRDELVAGMANRQYDLGVAYAYPGTKQAFLSQLGVHSLAAKVICPCQAVALIGQGSPYYHGTCRSLSVEQLAGMRRVFYTHNGTLSYSRTQLPQLERCQGTILVNDLRDFYAALQTLPAFSIVPLSLPLLQQGYERENLHYLPIGEETILGEYYQITRRDTTLAPVYRQLLEILAHLLGGGDVKSPELWKSII